MNRVKVGCVDVAKTYYLSLHAYWLCSPLATSASVGVNTFFPSSLLYNQINHQRISSGYMSVCRFWNNLSSLRQFSARRGLSWLAFEQSSSQRKADNNMASKQERKELDERASQGETVVPGGTGGKSLEAQEHLAEGRSRGGQTRREQLGQEGYQEMGSKGGQTRREQLGHEGYQEMGRKGGLSTMEKSGGERAEEEGITIDESKFRKNP